MFMLISTPCDEITKSIFFLKQAIFTKDLISSTRRHLSWTDRFTTSRPNSQTRLAKFLHTQKCMVGTCRTRAGKLHGASLQPSLFYFELLTVLLLLKRSRGGGRWWLTCGSHRRPPAGAPHRLGRRKKGEHARMATSSLSSWRSRTAGDTAKQYNNITCFLKLSKTCLSTHIVSFSRPTSISECVNIEQLIWMDLYHGWRKGLGVADINRAK